MRIPLFGGRSSIPIGRTPHYVLFRYLKKKRLCVHLMLAAHRACFSALSMEEGLETFPRMSKYNLLFDLQFFPLSLIIVIVLIM